MAADIFDFYKLTIQQLFTVNYISYFFFLSEAILEFLEKIGYDTALCDAARNVLYGADWSALLCVYLIKIDFSAEGIFKTTYKAEIESIKDELREEFPNIRSVDRLTLQYCAYLANFK